VSDPSALRTLSAVRGFLDEEVVPSVPQHVAGEVRAAIKLLESVERELDDLHVVLLAECTEMLELCGAGLGPLARDPQVSPQVDELGALQARLRERVADAPDTLTDRGTLHAEVRDLCAQVVSLLQTAEADGVGGGELHSLYAVLGRHAERRVPLQSVFPVSPARA
jgi:hypothetical protein